MKKIYVFIGLCLLLFAFVLSIRFYNLNQRYSAFVDELKTNKSALHKAKLIKNSDRILVRVKDGQEFTLNEVLSKNENNFVNFWYTGCYGCVYEMPSLNDFHSKYKDKISFAFISNDSVEAVRKFMKKKDLDLPFYVFKDKTFPEFLYIFPTSYYSVRKKDIFLVENVGYFNSHSFYNFINDSLE